MRTIHALPLLVAAMSIGGCRQQAPEAGNTAPGAAGAPAVPPEPPPPPPPAPAPFDAAAVGKDGARTPIAADGSTATVPADARFDLVSPQAFQSVRVRLFDARDRLVPSTDELAIGRGTTVRLEPNEPLEAGAIYRLEIDDARETRPRDIEGRAYEPRAFRFAVAAPSSGGAGGAATP